MASSGTGSFDFSLADTPISIGGTASLTGSGTFSIEQVIVARGDFVKVAPLRPMVAIEASVPIAGNGGAVGWEARAFDRARVPSDWDLTVSAICVDGAVAPPANPSP
jgi:hypothetical protein